MTARNEQSTRTQLSLPPPEHDSMVRWTLPVLVVTLLLCLPVILMDLGGRDSTHTMENVALVTSQETWQRVHEGEPLAG